MRGRAAHLLAALVLVASHGVLAHTLGMVGPVPDQAALFAEHGTLPERVRALIDAYHASGDDRLLEEGWSLLAPALNSDTTGPETMLAAAWLAQAGHDFGRAQLYLRHVVALSPGNGEGWLLRASVALVQGDLDTAQAACRRSTLTIPLAVTAACFAQVEAYGGDPERTRHAYRRLTAMLKTRSPADRSLLGWLHGAAADLAARGGLTVEAAERYRVALRLAPSVTVRAGYADLLLMTGHPDRVLTIIDAADTAPPTVLRRLMAQKMLGTGPSRQTLAEISGQFQSWITAGEFRHAREMALFYLTVAPDPALAYRLAERNYRNQREPEDRALLCETAARVGQRIGADCGPGIVGLPMIRAVSSAYGH